MVVATRRFLGVLLSSVFPPLYLCACLAFAGWKLAFIFCRQQESRRLMSRAEEDKLMQEFFKERRQERAEENGVRQEHKFKTLRVVFQ